MVEGQKVPEARRDQAGLGRTASTEGTGVPLGAPERISALTVLTIFGLVLLGSVAIVLIPRWIYPSAPKSPPVGLVLGVGLGVTAISSGAIYAVLALRKRFWSRVVIFALMYNGMIALVGFILVPEALHETTLTTELTRSGLATDVKLIGLASFLVYALVAAFVYQTARQRVYRALHWQFTPHVLLVGLLLFLGGPLILGVLAFVGEGNAWLVVGGGGFGLAVVAGVVASITIELVAFRTVADQAVMLRNASVLVGFFWVALAILAGYHIAWVVYILWLTSTWPLKPPSGC
jgi:hypothetical protein